MLLRFRSTPHALRAAESLNGPGAPPGIGFGRGVQKLAAFASSVAAPPNMHQFVMSCAAAVEVVHRVVRPVRVRRREDEDVQLVDQLPRRLVDSVVPEQLLRGLEARQRSRPLAGMLLAVQEDADATAVNALVGAVPRPVLPDPQHEVLERTALHVRVRRGREEVGQVALRPRLDDPGPRVAAVGLRNELRERTWVGVDRRRHLGGRARERTGRARRQPDAEVVADEAHRERRVRNARIDELGREVVTALVAPRARREDDGLGPDGRAEVPRAQPDSSDPPSAPGRAAGTRSSCTAAG